MLSGDSHSCPYRSNVLHSSNLVVSLENLHRIKSRVWTQLWFSDGKPRSFNTVKAPSLQWTWSGNSYIRPLKRSKCLHADPSLLNTEHGQEIFPLKLAIVSCLPLPKTLPSASEFAILRIRIGLSSHRFQRIPSCVITLFSQFSVVESLDFDSQSGYFSVAISRPVTELT